MKKLDSSDFYDFNLEQASHTVYIFTIFTLIVFMYRVKNLRGNTVSKANNLSPVAVMPSAPVNKPVIKIKQVPNINNGNSNRNVVPKSTTTNNNNSANHNIR